MEMGLTRISLSNATPTPASAPYYAYGQAESIQTQNLTIYPTENLITYDGFSSVKNITIDLLNGAINFNQDGAYLIGINLNVQFSGNHNLVVYPRINGNNDYYYAQVFNLETSPVGKSVFAGFTMLKIFNAGDNIQFYATTNGTGTTITPDVFNNVYCSVRNTVTYVGTP